MTSDELSQAAVEADLASARYRAGVTRRHWRTTRYAHPELVVAVRCTAQPEDPCEYEFKFELIGYKPTAPAVRIWDSATSGLLAVGRRPQFSPRVIEAFKVWGNDTVYRPWDRLAMAHGDWARAYPTLVWHADRDLAFILEDLHALLCPSVRAVAV